MIYLGTAGWAYKHWRGSFYPRDIENELEYYSTYSNMIEINTTFYQLPSLTTIRIWYHFTPEDFIFSAKLSRQITHSSKYDDKSELLERFFERMKGLDEKLKVVLLQFPPRFRKTTPTEKFLSKLLNKCLNLFSGYLVVELRNSSWFSDDFILDNFQEMQVVLANSTKQTIPNEFYKLSKIYYIRIIGDRKEMPDEFLGKILLNKKKELNDWISKIKVLNKNYSEIFVVINNRFSGYAINDAIKIHRALIKEGIEVKGFNKYDKYKKRHMTLSEFI